MLHKSTIVLLLYYVGGPVFMVAFLLACVLYCTRTRCMSNKLLAPPRLASSAPTPACELSTPSDYYYMSLSHIYRPMAFSTPLPLPLSSPAPPPPPLYQMDYQQQQHQQLQPLSRNGPTFRPQASPLPAPHPQPPPPPPYQSHSHFSVHPSQTSAVFNRTVATYSNEGLPSYEEATTGSSPPSFEVACAMQKAFSNMYKFSRDQ